MQQLVTISRPADGLKRAAAQLKLRARQLLRDYPRETIGAGVLSLTIAGAIGGAAISGSVQPVCTLRPLRQGVPRGAGSKGHCFQRG